MVVGQSVVFENVETQVLWDGFNELIGTVINGPDMGIMGMALRSAISAYSEMFEGWFASLDRDEAKREEIMLRIVTDLERIGYQVIPPEVDMTGAVAEAHEGEDITSETELSNAGDDGDTQGSDEQPTTEVDGPGDDSRRVGESSVLIEGVINQFVSRYHRR